MRALDELIDTNEPGWALIEEWLKEAKNDYEILPRDESRAQSELLGLQVTTRSPMGALVYSCGGIVVDGGALRGKAGNVFYYAPDSGEWEDTQLGYSQFLYWVLCGDISKFYELYHWDGWRDDVRKFSLDRVMFTLPPILWQDANVKLRLKQMKKDGVDIDEYFASMFSGGE